MQCVHRGAFAADWLHAHVHLGRRCRGRVESVGRRDDLCNRSGDGRARTISCPGAISAALRRRIRRPAATSSDCARNACGTSGVSN